MAVGVVVLAMGIALAMLGIFKAGNPAEPLAFLAIPAGLVFVFGGLLVLLPAKLQLPLAALMVTSLAGLFDWVAFGPGGRHFTSSVGGPRGPPPWSAGAPPAPPSFGPFASLL